MKALWNHTIFQTQKRKLKASAGGTRYDPIERVGVMTTSLGRFLQ